MKKIYLAGAINGKSDAECKDWRELAKAMVDATFLDPMSRDYRGKELESVSEIVDGDKADIQSCDAVVVMAETPSWGTAMEVFFAHSLGIPVHSVCSRTPSPWLVYHSTVHKDLASAVAAAARA